MTFRSFIKFGVLCTLIVTLTGQVAMSRTLNPKDPYEPFNRVMFNFNEVIDKIILRPLAFLYNKIVPKPLTKCISNFFANIDTVPTVANDVLQVNFYQATSDAWRLTLNSTFGLLGFFDVAAMIGLEPNSEDFGLTLAQWGYKNSNYLVLPFFGPSTPRDALGLPVNYFYLTIYPYIYPINVRYRIYGLGIVSRRADLARFQGVFQQAAVDKYVFIRDAYMQRRAYLIQRNTELGDPYLEKNKNHDQDHDQGDELDTEISNQMKQAKTQNTADENKQKPTPDKTSDASTASQPDSNGEDNQTSDASQGNHQNANQDKNQDAGNVGNATGQSPNTSSANST